MIFRRTTKSKVVCSPKNGREKKFCPRIATPKTKTLLKNADYCGLNKKIKKVC